MPATRRPFSGGVAAVGEAAVATEGPLGLGRGFRTWSAGVPFTLTRRARRLGTSCDGSCTPGWSCEDGEEAGELVVLDVDEEEGGGDGGELVEHLGADVALDEGDGGEGGEAETEGDEHQRRGGAGAVEVGDAHAERLGELKGWGVPGQEHQEGPAAGPEQDEGGGCEPAQNQRAKRAVRRGDDEQADQGGNEGGVGGQHAGMDAPGAVVGGRRRGTGQRLGSRAARARG